MTVVRARLVIERQADGERVADTVVSIAPGATEVDAAISVPVTSDRESFDLYIQLIDAAGDTVFRGGPETVEAVVGASADGVTPVTVEVTYTGIGADAVDVRIVSGAFVAPGGTVQLTAEALDAQGAVIAETPIAWASLDPTVATVPDPAVGTVVAGAEPGQARITATLLTGQADTVIVSVGFRSGNVLILSNCSSCNAVVLDSFGLEIPGLTFDTLDVNITTPTLAFLQQFGVVLLFEDGTFPNAVNVGDSVGAYVAAGGSAVIGTFYWQEPPAGGFGGVGWGALDQYDPFQTVGGSEYNADSMDPQSVVAHPITTGVTSLSVQSYHGGVSAKQGTTVLATWSDGVPLVGYRVETAGQRLVSISLYPGYPRFSGEFSGDFYQLWGNALAWAAGAVPAVSPSSAPAAITRAVPAQPAGAGPPAGGSGSGRR